TQSSPRPVDGVRALLSVLNPFAPHLTEELSERLGGTALLAHEPWPKYDPTLLIEDEIELPVQVNGKVRDKIIVKMDAPTKDLEEAAKSAPGVVPHLEGKTIK